MAMVWYFKLLIGPLTACAGVFQSIVGVMLVSGRRLLEVMTKPGETRWTGHQFGSDGLGKLVFDRVSFSYDNSSSLLEDVSFTVEAGSLTALIGPSGCGKTTLAHLAMALQEGYSGSIRIGGVDIQTLGRAQLRKLITLAPQDPFLWEATILDNLRYSSPKSTTMAEIVEAVSVAQLHEAIVRMPDGYDTRVGGTARILSAGEKQRLGVAQAILRKTPVIVLDEPFANVDPCTMERMGVALRGLRGDRTILLISHQLGQLFPDRTISLHHQGERPRVAETQSVNPKGAIGVPVDG
jgi:ABC-type multidrug transport system fused ATPase/permease subunit